MLYHNLERKNEYTISPQFSLGRIGYSWNGHRFLFPVSVHSIILTFRFAVFGLLFSVVAIVLSSSKEYAIAGCVLCAVAIFLGAIRLVLGFGVF